MKCVVSNGKGSLTFQANHPVVNPNNWPLWDVCFCGICKSDQHFVYQEGSKGLILGHEVVCRDDRGRYFVLNNEIACGRCEHCLEGETSHCRHLQELGVNRHGGYAEKIPAPRESLYRLTCRNKMIGVLAEPLACVFHALDRLARAVNLDGGKKVLIIGSGVSGKLLAHVLITHYPMLSLSLYDIAAESMQWASAFPSITRLTDIRDPAFPLVVECTGAPDGLAQGIAAVRNGGVLMLYGIQPEGTPLMITAEEILFREITVLPSRAGCSPDTFSRALAHLAAHQTFFDSMLGKVIPLEQLPGELRPGQALQGTRTVIKIGSSQSADA
ncbi:zinc-binding dehydrogenase [Martelella alba]|uniref:Theronine dehydrogenase n=1 Tax=Martelella alba TaxID=2590451 RepID=A0ABY2SFC7_9HYPH|nr:alcohol dehydrogenase catalytic domain-containing protein [Martelella alba]TKI03364.1 theronine dehydrogenase [Martelella alba]